MKLTTYLKSRDNVIALCLDLIRIYLGVGLFLKGIHFVHSPVDLTSWLQHGNLLFLETVFAHYVVLAHLSGGFLLILGLLTRIWALIQIPILVGAIGFVHFQEGLFSRSQNLEFSILVLFLLVIIVIIGGGPLSADEYFKKADEDSAAIQE